MIGRFSKEEKGKGLSNELTQAPRTGRIKIQAPVTSALLQKHSLTLIGRVTNKSVQKVWFLIPFFTDSWKAHGRPVGSDLGNGLFQFQFDKEEDLVAVLEKRPFHFAKWMIIAQRWEPTASPSFPSLIPFWIKVQGIPVHLWTEETISELGEDIGIFEKAEITPLTVRMRVQVNGLLPLMKTSVIEYSNGDEVKVSFVYERLDKHCSKCFCLDHDIKDCLVAKHEQRALKQKAEQAREDSQSQDMRRNRADDNSEVFRFTASRAGEDHSKRYPGKIPFDRRTDARRYINDNRRSRTYQEASYRSYNNPKPMEWREKGHHRPPQQHREQDTRPGNNSARHSSHRAGPRSPGPALPREHYYPILDKPGGNQREESSSSRDMMIDGVRGNPLPTSPVLDNQKNVSEALDVIRGTMTHYTQVADPTESAIRRERVRLTEERGQIEEAARKMAKNLRTKSPTLQQSPPENERVPAIQRLGPVEPALVDNTQPAETVWTKRKPGRPPGRRVTPSSPKPTRSASSKKRSAQQAKQPPNKRKLTTEAHRLKKTPTKKASSRDSETKSNATNTSENQPICKMIPPRTKKRMDFQIPYSLGP